VEISEDYFAPQLAYFDMEDTFGVQGRIIGIDSDEIQDAGKYPSIRGLKISTTKKFFPVVHNKPVPTFFLSGANALVDRKKLMELGGFCELYSPFYGEDADLCMRAWRAGWKCYYEHRSICRHPASTTIAAYHQKRKIKTISYRNRLIMHYLHFNGFRLFCWSLKTAADTLVKALILRITFFKGMAQFFRLFSKVCSYKKGI
jgi:GT2 family glycosyltransferase